MELTPEQRAAFIGKLGNELLQADIATLGENGCSDTILGLMAGEHLGRTAALVNCIQDATFARNLLIITSNQLLERAKDIDRRTKSAVFVEEAV